MASVDCPVFIIGAGISGLTLAQVLRKNGIPFRILERKEHAEAGGAGWGFTINWSLESLMEMLPPELAKRFPETFVDQEAVTRGEDATFPFFDLLTGEMKHEVPRNHKRVRVNRDKLRKLLMTDMNVEWSKGLKDVTMIEGSDIVTVHVEDGTAYTTYLVVGCDGTHSRVRRSLFPSGWTNKPVPANMFGMTIAYPAEQLSQIRKLDSFFLHGTDRENGVYFWFSLLDVPSNYDKPATNDCNCQILVSWPSAPGFMGQEKPVDPPANNSERHTFLKQLSEKWADPFGPLIRLIPESIEVKTVTLDDWIPEYYGGAESNKGRGKVILMGDSGHTMTMYRGEGANHAIMDVYEFSKAVVPTLRNVLSESVSADDLIRLAFAAKAYEDAMFKRCWIAVLASRQATIDAHQWERITNHSPLVAKRQKFLHDSFNVDNGILT
ncbi:hypothetical protein B7463_g4091, partial [Scytalidium lignicola]